MNFIRKLFGKKPKYRVKAWRDDGFDYANYRMRQIVIEAVKKMINQSYVGHIKTVNIDGSNNVITIRKPTRYLGRDSIHNNS